MTDELPRLLNRGQAAKHLGICVSTFSAWVSAGLLPKPVFGSKRWDRKALDAAIDRESGISRQPAEPVETEYRRRKRERAAEETPYQRWKRQSRGQ